MMTAKVFKNGQSQAVRLPKEYRFKEDEVSVNKIGDAVILLPKSNPWGGFIESLNMFSEDYMCDEREQQGLQERESL